jgi:hypothetical protein
LKIYENNIYIYIYYFLKFIFKINTLNVKILEKNLNILKNITTRQTSYKSTEKKEDIVLYILWVVNFNKKK